MKLLSPSLLSVSALCGVASAVVQSNSSTCIRNQTSTPDEGFTPDNATAWGTFDNTEFSIGSNKYQPVYTVFQDGWGYIGLTASPDSYYPNDTSEHSLCIMSATYQLETTERGQTDDGTCTSLLDSACIAELKSITQDAANQAVMGRLNSHSGNNTWDSASICRSIQSDLGAYAQRNGTACKTYFGPTNMTTIGTLASRNLGENDTCIAPNHVVKPNWQYTSLYGTKSAGIDPLSAFYGRDDYAVAYRNVWSVLNVAFPNNPSPGQTPSGANTSIGCLRVTNTAKGATTPSPLPKPSAASGILSPQRTLLVGSVAVALVTIMSFGGIFVL